MRRLAVLLAVLLAGAAMARMVMAQQVSGLPRVGLLFVGSAELSRGSAEFQESMQLLGWTEGSNFSIEYSFANGDPARLSANAADLAAARVDVIVAFGPLASQAARHATSAIPIVGATVDPSLVASLARPGGNITGVTMMMPDITAKQLQLLKEAVPRISKVGVLMHPDTPGQAQMMAELERAAQGMAISVLPVAAGIAQDLPRCFNEITAIGADAYFVLAGPATNAMRADIAALALLHDLPGAAQVRFYVEAGVLLSYAPSLSAAQRRAAVYVDKILKGAKPADLPVEQPTIFKLVVNMKTARALGLTIPQSILARADEVIE